MAVLEIPELNAPHVRMKDRNHVMNKINKIKSDGIKHLQIITDFDRTITKHHHNGVCTMSSYAIYKLIPTLPEGFVEGTDALYNKFRVIEEDPKMSIQDKLPHMVEWWKLNEKWFLGLPYNEANIDQAAKDSKVVLRTGVDEAFQRLFKLEIPVLVFSAGLGDVVSAIIKEYNINYDNVKVISNFFNVENDTIVGFKGTLLHIYNKNEHAIENSDYFKELSHRENVILMGDSLGDANMAEGVQGNGEVLKIGFLSSHIDDFLPQYLDLFDIVLLDDQTMEVFNSILEKIL